MIDIPSYQKCIQAAALQYKKHPSEMGQIVSEMLSNFEINTSSLKENESLNKRSSFEIDSHKLLPYLFTESTHPLMKSIHDCAQSLCWRPSGFGKLPPEITNHVAVVEIVGPDGMLIDLRLRFGLLLQDPHVIYAKHQHAAEELYFVLSGIASWAVDDDELSKRDEREFIHHAKNQPHQMRTNDQPLLAMWAWLGDIGSESYSI